MKLKTKVSNNSFYAENDASNYRPVSIISIICKIFEACVLVHIESMLTSHINQFGFVQKGGCNEALFAFTSILYKENPMFISAAWMLQRHLTHQSFLFTFLFN